MRERLIRAARVLLAVVILAFVVRTFARNWDALRAEPIRWVFHPTPALGAVLLVWGMYAILIEAWRRMLAGWGDHLPYATAARIWVLSSLGKYVPGKVWAIAGMALMARDAGVSGWAATASAIILQVLAIGTGIGPENSDGMRVLTIAMTAPQQVHKMGARSLNQAVA